MCVRTNVYSLVSADKLYVRTPFSVLDMEMNLF